MPISVYFTMPNYSPYTMLRKGQKVELLIFWSFHHFIIISYVHIYIFLFNINYILQIIFQTSINLFICHFFSHASSDQYYIYMYMYINISMYMHKSQTYTDLLVLFNMEYFGLIWKLWNCFSIIFLQIILNELLAFKEWNVLSIDQKIEQYELLDELCCMLPQRPNY